MEPTIYKPSIYKGAGIYKTGAGGGGGGGGGGNEYLFIGTQKYELVEINGKKWTKENLAYKFAGIGFNGAGGSSSPYCYYKDYSGYIAYGFLYNYAAVEYIQNNKDSLIPGFHVPTEQDYLDLISFVGSNHAEKIKDTKFWSSNAGTNELNFCAKPNIYRDHYGNFYTSNGNLAYFFTSTNFGGNSPSYLYMNNSDQNLGISNNFYPEYALPIRLVSD